MTNAQPHRRQRSKARRVVTAIHKWIGLGSALIVIIISATGLMLNHTSGLNLDHTPADSRWMLDWYGLSPAGEQRGFSVGEHWFVEVDGEFFFDAEPAANEGRLIGAGKFGDELVAVFEQSALLFSVDGELLEKIDALGEGQPILRAGIAEGELAIETANGVFVLAGLLTSKPLGSREVSWFEPAEIPADIHAQVQAAFSGDGLPMSRVILDIHSGRFFGSIGVVIYDLAAIAFLVLAGTGLWLGLRKRRHRPQPEMDDRGPYADIS